MKLNGFDSAEHTVRTAARSGKPGAISTSAPAASNACSRLIVSSRSGLPRMKFSARAVSVNGNDIPRAASTAAAMRSARGPHRTTASADCLWHPRSSRRPGLFRLPGGCVSAASAGVSPNPFSRSADTGRSVASKTARAVCQRLIARDHAVTPAQHPRRRATRGRQCRKTDTGQNARRTRVPGIGNHECPRCRVQRTEPVGLLNLTGRHGVALRCLHPP